ncbi:MAG TPA: substrate-binding domain-containing protein [Variovorax sp.]|nr:substrate-binding domain-containing protein [Variovorax sp.]
MNVLCAGAAQGLVKAMQGVFLEFTGARIDGCFGSVGAMREAFVAGAPCDVLIVTADMLAELHAAGLLVDGSLGTLGRVRTGLAVRSEANRPDVSTPEALKASLLAATAIYAPDARRSTAGIHFASVLRELDIAEAVASRLRSAGDGGRAMREMAADTRAGVLGCAQITQIRYTPGITLAGAFPPQFELAPVYAAAVSARAAQPEQAKRFVDLLTGARTRVMRQQVGFEAVAAVPACFGATIS